MIKNKKAEVKKEKYVFEYALGEHIKMQKIIDKLVSDAMNICALGFSFKDIKCKEVRKNKSIIIITLKRDEEVKK